MGNSHSAKNGAILVKYFSEALWYNFKLETIVNLESVENTTRIIHLVKAFKNKWLLVLQKGELSR